MPGHEAPGRPLRADAERNRRRILAAASTVFAERGLDVSLDDIAAAAGVGIATVYRRFPDKEALIDELFETKMRAIERLAADALEIEDPWTAFSTFMREVCRLHAQDRGLKEALLSDHRGRDRVRRARDTIAPRAVQLLRRAQEAGAVRADLAAFDVPLLHTAVGLIADRTRDVAPDYWERMVTIVLDGLRAERRSATPMTAPPLSPEQFAAALAPERRPGAT
jgi:AcrR family transcriptional regulator